MHFRTLQSHKQTHSLDKSICLSFLTQLNSQHTAASRGEVGSCGAMSKGLLLLVLLSCLPSALSGCGGAYVVQADGAASQSQMSNRDFGNSSVGQDPSAKRFSASQNSAAPDTLDTTRIDATQRSVSLDRRNDAQ